MNIRKVWNNAAFIIFMAGVFFSTTIFGISGILIGIFMWVIGGSLFGSVNSKKKQTIKQNQEIINPPNSQTGAYCASCGTVNEANYNFCVQCGATSTYQQPATNKAS